MTPLTAAVERAIESSLARRAVAALAVSGGVDSVVLLEAATRVAPGERIVVATFDHGTGSAATAAASFVEARCAELRIECVRGGLAGDRSAQSEAALRDARWSFLRRVAADRDAAVFTAHTRDDQIETVLMRILRGAGARGLAGLLAPSAVERPFLAIDRAAIARYAAERRVEWVEDPSNDSRRYLRNRVRHDLLPALRRANPLIVDELLDVARRAAEVRAQVDVRVTELLGARARGAAAARALDVPASALAGRRTQELALLWPAIAAHVGLALDRRGTARLADFSVNARVGSRVQVSGGWEVARGRSVFQLRTWALVSPPAVLERGGIVRWGRWLFRSASPGEQGARDGARDGGERDAVWSILIPSRGHMSVRGWLAGDTMQVAADGTPRRVKRLLSAAGVTGRDRVGWPVVLLDDAIVWIPGVRRANITAPRGEAGLTLRCEQLNR